MEINIPASFTLPAIFPIPVINGDLMGNYVYLVPLEEQKRELIRQLARDPRIWEFNRTLIVNDNYDEQFDRYFDTALDLANQDGQSFTIHRLQDQRLIGMTRMHSVIPASKRLEIGHTWYVMDVHGKVYNRECKLLLLQYAFEKLQFIRVEFRVAGQNLRSQKAVERIGGVREGELRKAGFRNDGSITNIVIFSMIDEEWPEKKTKLSALISRSSA